MIKGKIALALLTLLAIAGCASAATYSNPYFTVIIIDHTKVSGDLSDFPVLIKIVNDTDIGAKAQANGYDLKFSLPDGTPLSYERENYSIVNGKCNAFLWVKIPYLSSTSDTVIYLNYGNATTVDGQNKTGVWDNSFNGVYHLNETGTGTVGDYKDSTSYAHDSISTTDQPAVTSGIIGNAQQFDGSTNYITLGNDLSNTQTNGTVSALIKIPALLNSGITGDLFSVASTTDPEAVWYIGLQGINSTSTRIKVGSNLPNVNAVYGSTDIKPNTFYHVAVTVGENITSPASPNAVAPSIPDKGLLGENIIYDDTTGKYWWIYENRSTGTAFVNLAYADSIDGTWTQQPGNIIAGQSPDLKKFGGKWYIYYGNSATDCIDAINSTSVNKGYGSPVQMIAKGNLGTWDYNRVTDPCMINNSGTYRMLFMGEDVANGYEKVGYAESNSPDREFVKSSKNPVLSGNTSAYDTGLDRAANPFIFTKTPSDGKYYIGVTACVSGKNGWNIGLFSTTNFINYTRVSPYPILMANLSSEYDDLATLRSAITNVNGTYYQSYTMKGSDQSYRMGLTKFSFGPTTTEWNMYVNGNPELYTAYVGSNAGLWWNTSNNGIMKYTLGTLQRSTGNIGYLKGAMQELRMSDTNRSTSWISTESNNQLSPLTFSSVNTSN